MKISYRKALLAALGAVGVGAIGFFGGMAAWRYFTATVVVAGATEAGCDLHRGACRAHFPGGGEMLVSIAPRPIPLVRPLTVTVELRNMPAERVEADFGSPDMYMGYNRRPLEPQGGGKFTGQSVLPVCILDRMRWKLTIYAEAGRTRREASFMFETVTDRSKVGR